MADEPLTLRGIFQSIGEWLVEAGRWMVVTFNRILDWDFRGLIPILEFIGFLIALTILYWIWQLFIWPPFQRKIDVRDEAKRRKKRRDLGYDDEEE